MLCQRSPRWLVKPRDGGGVSDDNPVFDFRSVREAHGADDRRERSELLALAFCRGTAGGLRAHVRQRHRGRGVADVCDQWRGRGWNWGCGAVADLSVAGVAVVCDDCALSFVAAGRVDGMDVGGDKAWHTALANGLSHPALRVSCYQWAFKPTPTGVVPPIVALTPMVIIPFARYDEGERPSWRSVIGGAVAVSGAAALAPSR